ncbi:Ribonuclease H2 subunit B [Wickerhamiella sorbophila]|uniref:Ribonuclease H2 subunit B n=1 Tax=Wickerhamiella sorbophila TaxID=45607 RepID=A0A2T0FK58_9ASCO|nr:Ribonuclease H2 subunit B [Wickerhamiella sorbophila]PRT55376.1 Ribonuclease H2 subunit B [Wickerhamiella sorbophila]
MTTLLPPELLDRDVDLINLSHPKTGKLTTFAATESLLFQKVVVKNSGPHSLLFDGYVVSDPSISVFIPVNPFFVVLPVLFKCKDRHLPLDLLMDMLGDDDSDAFPTHLLQDLDKICQNENEMYKLDLEKLFVWLSALVAELEIPASLSAKYTRAIAPIDPTQPIDESLKQSVKEFAALQLVCSWLDEPTSEWLNSKYDFAGLTAHVDAIQSERAASLALQRLSEPAAAKKARVPPAKRPKVSKNKSVLDFFKKV